MHSWNKEYSGNKKNPQKIKIMIEEIINLIKSLGYKLKVSSWEVEKDVEEMEHRREKRNLEDQSTMSKLWIKEI